MLEQYDTVQDMWIEYFFSLLQYNSEGSVY